ncbi:MAG: GntR family transcriptional regulator [Clostridia bacterium]|nr:GntR family transcriptional regulator [Clostridia bacterium]
MIDFKDFRAENGSPIYVQIVKHVKRRIASGAIADGDEMISRRALSALLGINPNTVQKAYAILESEGLISSHSGAASYAVVDAEAVKRIRSEMLEDDISSVVSSLKQMNLTKEEALDLIERMWSE